MRTIDIQVVAPLAIATGVALTTVWATAVASQRRIAHAARIQIGLESTCTHDIKEVMFQMKSMLTYDPENDSSLIQLLWRYHGRVDTYTVKCLEDLTSVMS